MALEDTQRTMGLVRLRGAEWHIDPHKIGVLGFSAGEHLVAAISNHFAQPFILPSMLPTTKAAGRILRSLFMPGICLCTRRNGMLGKARRNL
jgi:acetyl esterase/lipase